MAEDAGGDEETAGVWPWYDLVLAPPPRDHNTATLHSADLNPPPPRPILHTSHRSPAQRSPESNQQNADSER